MSAPRRPGSFHRYALFAAVLLALGAPSVAHADSSPAFKTPGDAAYCQMETTGYYFTAFRCFTPNDGWWIRFTGLNGHNVRVTKGYNDRYRSWHPSGYRLLAFGKKWYSSDAATIICWSRSTGLTCKNWYGLSFWIGRYKGYRIYAAPAGERVLITQRFFRTSFGVWCGLGPSMEPSAPYVICFRPSDGVEVALYYSGDGRSGWQRNENDLGYRPTDYPVLGAGATFRWACSKVDSDFADGCRANAAGTAVFTCENSGGKVTCRNPKGHGFWVSRSGFYNF